MVGVTDKQIMQKGILSVYRKKSDFYVKIEACHCRSVLRQIQDASGEQQTLLRKLYGGRNELGARI